MYLSEVKAGSSVIVESLDGIKPERRSIVRDLGAYENGLLFVDGIEGGRLLFHKDAEPVSMAIEDAEKILVRLYEPAFH